MMMRVALLVYMIRFSTLLHISAAQSREAPQEQCTARNLMQIAAKGRAQEQVYMISELEEAKPGTVPPGPPLKDIEWTTNIGRTWNACGGSDFYQKDGKVTDSSLKLKNGLLLKKGKCPKVPGQVPDKQTSPLLTRELSCYDTTGCHQSCSPVWQSDRDTKNWTLMDELCKSWDGHTVATDSPTCGTTSQIFSWIRTLAPKRMNRLYMKFGIPETTFCEHWCAPMWVTLYDTEDYGKSYRWCFGNKGDWGGCDVQESIKFEEFKEYTFKLSMFSVKHLYKPQEMKVEVAIWNEFLNSELAIQNFTFFHQAMPPPAPGEDTTCGTSDRCDEDMKCCPKMGAANGKCCPTTSNCCGELCCPSYYICNLELEGAARCSPPPEDLSAKPPNITICSGDM